MEIDPTLLTKLIQTLESLANKIAVGVPTGISGSNPLVLSTTDEKAKAATWGAELQVGKFFPNNKSVGILKPLTAILRQIFLDELPTKLKDALTLNLGGGVSGSFNFGGGTIFGQFSTAGILNISDAILQVSKTLALSAVGFMLFANVTWSGVIFGIGTLGSIMVMLISYKTKLGEVKGSIDDLLVVGKTLGLVALSFIAFSFVSLVDVGIGLSTLFGFLAMVGLFKTYTTETKTILDELLVVGKTLGLVALSFIAFSFVNLADVGIGLIAFGAILLSIIIFNKYVDESKTTLDKLLIVGKALGLIAASFIAFSFVNLADVGIGLSTLFGFLVLIGAYKKFLPDVTGAVEDLLVVGKALGLIAASFIAFGLVTGEAFLAGLGSLALVVAAVVSLSKMERDINTGTNLLLKVSGALLLSSVGFLIFNFVDRDSIYDGILALAALVGAVVLMSKFNTQLTLGSLALILVAAALIPVGYAFSLLKGVDWSVGAAAVVGIGALAVIAGIIGSFGAAALPVIGIGALAIAVLGAALIPLAYAFNILGGIDSVRLPQIGSDIGMFVGNLVSGLGFGVLMLPILGLALALLSVGLTPLANTLKTLQTLTTSKLPEIGTNLGKFLTNLNENITVSTLGFLPKIATSLTGLGSSLLDFGKSIPMLVTLPTSGLVFFGGVVGKFLDSLTENISIGSINRVRVLMPLLADISPILVQLSESVQRFGDAQTNILPAKATDIGNFFKNLDINTGWFGDADNKITALKQFGEAIQSLKAPDQSFSEFINAFSSLGDVKINVDVLSSETKKTNEILQTSVSIQTQQLNELKQQTSLLSKMQMPQNVSTGNQAQPYPSSVNAIPGTRDQYNNSSYFLKSR